MIYSKYIPILNDIWFLVVIGDAHYNQKYILSKSDKPVLITIETWKHFGVFVIIRLIHVNLYDS